MPRCAKVILSSKGRWFHLVRECQDVDKKTQEDGDSTIGAACVIALR